MTALGAILQAHNMSFRHIYLCAFGLAFLGLVTICLLLPESRNSSLRPGAGDFLRFEPSPLEEGHTPGHKDSSTPQVSTPSTPQHRTTHDMEDGPAVDDAPLHHCEDDGEGALEGMEEEEEEEEDTINEETQLLVPDGSATTSHARKDAVSPTSVTPLENPVALPHPVECFSSPHVVMRTCHWSSPMMLHCSDIFI